MAKWILASGGIEAARRQCRHKRGWRKIDELAYALYDLPPDEIALIEAAR